MEELGPPPGPPDGYQKSSPQDWNYGPPLEDQVRAPALWMLVVAGISLAINFLILAVNLFQNEGRANRFTFGSDAFGIGISVCQMLLWGLVCYGSLQMMKLQSYGLSMTAAIICVVPFLSPCCVIGIPFGIWAIVVLNKPGMRQSFM